MSATTEDGMKSEPNIQDEDFGDYDAMAARELAANEAKDIEILATSGPLHCPDCGLCGHSVFCAHCGAKMIGPAADNEKEGLVELLIANNVSLLRLIWTDCCEEMGQEPRSWKQTENFASMWLPAILIATILVIAGLIGAAILIGWNFAARLVIGAITVSVTTIRRLRRRMKKATSEVS